MKKSRRLWWIALSLLAVAAAACLVKLGHRKLTDQLFVRTCRDSLAAIFDAVHRFRSLHGAYPDSIALLCNDGLVAPRYCLLNEAAGYEYSNYMFIGNLTPQAAPGWIVAFDAEARHGTGLRAVLYVSGEVQFIPEMEFQRVFEEFASQFKAAAGTSPLVRDPQ